MRPFLTLCAALLVLGCQPQQTTPPNPAATAWSIAIHGGAGVGAREAMSAEAQADFRAALERAIVAGATVLEGGGSAMDAAEITAKILEDEPLFNAGRGAVFTAAGTNELDASIMNGATRAAGAVAGLTRTRNPISAARAVMEKSGHVMLAGAGADAFAAEQGLEQVEPAYFFTERRWAQLEKRLREQGRPIPARPKGAPPPTPVAPAGDVNKRGTIGVVARDLNGDFAAATSTGGMTAKRFGRIGDSPIVGAGTYAQNGVCAVSATGAGEYFIRLSVARSICALIELKGLSAQEAADQLIQKDLSALGGDGGVIVLGPRGEVAMSFNADGMFRASQTAGQPPSVGIFKGE